MAKETELKDKEVKEKEVKGTEDINPNNPNNADDTVPKKKKRRRGISNETRTKSRNKITDKYLDPVKRLCGVIIDKVEVVNSNYREGTNSGFAGYEVPELHITFKTAIGKTDDEKGWYVERFQPIECTMETMEKGEKAYIVDGMFSKLKHYIDVCVKNYKPLTEDEEDELCLDFEEIDDQGNFLSPDTQEVLDSYGKVFNAVQKMFYAEDSTAFKNKDNSVATYYLKLTRYYKDKKTGAWKAQNQDQSLSTANFVGQGLIERAKVSGELSLEIDIANEKVSIIPDYSNTTTRATLGGQVSATRPQIPVQQPMLGTTGVPMEGGNPADNMPF